MENQIAQTWEQAQQWEREWHGECLNSYNEETKQYIYASHMGLNLYRVNDYGQIGWDFGRKSVLDVGCGPYSILLKSRAGFKMGIDPCKYPDWVDMRYGAADVKIVQDKAENMLQWVMITERHWDEVLMYNCLQHTEDPEKIVTSMRQVAKTIRVFEWIDTPVTPGHLHTLTEANLNKWLGGKGKTGLLSEGPVVGKAYWGIFKGEQYGKI